MKPIKKPAGIDIKVLLSTLWLFVLLNMIFRDIHEIPTPEFLEQAMAGVFNGTRVTDELLLFAGIVLELPIAMVLLSRILNYQLNRWLNISIAFIMIGAIISNNLAPDLDDAFFAVVELIALFCIAWQAWRWSNPIATEVDTANVVYLKEAA